MEKKLLIQAELSNPEPVEAPKPEGCEKCHAEPHLMLYADGSVHEARLKCQHKSYTRTYAPQEMGVPGGFDRGLIWDHRMR